MKTTFAHSCALRLLRHYPHAWRERYADEASAVLEERPATFRTLFDLLLGMLDAYLHTELFTERKFVMLQRLRNSQINIFGSFVCFAFFWTVYSLIDANIYQSGVPSYDLASSVPNYAFVFPLVRIIGLLAVLTTLIGGCSFITLALKQAFARDQQNIFPFACILISTFASALLIGITILEINFYMFYSWVMLPIFVACFIIFLLFALLGSLFRLWQGIKNAELSLRFMYPILIPGLVILVIMGTFFLTFFYDLSSYLFVSKNRMILLPLALLIIVGSICGGTVYLARRLRQIEFSPHALHLTFTLASLTALAMLVMLGLLLYETQIIDLHANALGFKLLRIPLLNIIAVGTALPTAFACISLWRGFKARQELMVLV